MNKFLFLVLFILVLITGCGGASIMSEEDVADAIAFKTEYENLNNKFYKLDINKDNPFKYITFSNFDDVLNGTNIIFVGYSSSNISRGVVSFILSHIEGLDVKPIYYFDLDGNRPEYSVDNNGLNKINEESELYLKFINAFDEYVDYYYKINSNNYKTDIKFVNAPAIIFIKNGKVISYYDDFIKSNDDDFISFNNYEIGLISNNLYKIVDNYED